MRDHEQELKRLWKHNQFRMNKEKILEEQQANKEQNEKDALQILVNFLDKLVSDNPKFELAMKLYLKGKSQN